MQRENIMFGVTWCISYFVYITFYLLFGLTKINHNVEWLAARKRKTITPAKSQIFIVMDFALSCKILNSCYGATNSIGFAMAIFMDRFYEKIIRKMF